jgi:hypothetical protein
MAITKYLSLRGSDSDRGNLIERDCHVASHAWQAPRNDKQMVFVTKTIRK